METIKNCMQCGEEFAGRANKIYCSDKCKQEAFQDGKTQPTSNLRGITDLVKKSRYNEGEDLDLAKEVLKLQIELKKLEFDYNLELEKMKAQQKEKERNHEIVKQRNSISLEQEKVQLQLLKEQEEARKQLLKPKVENYQDYLEVTEDEGVADVKEEDEVKLDEDLKEEYEVLVKEYLSLHGTEIHLDSFNEMGSIVDDLMKTIKRWSRNEGLDADEFTEYLYLKGIKKDILKSIENINERSFWESSSIELNLEEKWKRQLKDSLGE